MSTITKPVEVIEAPAPESVIIRFIENVRCRSESDGEQRRRSIRRYHRSWPLEVGLPADQGGGTMTVALHNGSYQGISFLCLVKVTVDSRLTVRLFWHDEGCPMIPVVVRHVTPTPNGYLVGCEFDLRNG